MKKVQLFAAAVVAVAMTACAAPAEEAEVMTSTKVTTTRKLPGFKLKKIPLPLVGGGISYFKAADAQRTTSIKTESSVRSTFLYASYPQIFLAYAAFSRNLISSTSALDKSSNTRP